MAELRFKVKADYEELGKLRAEIQKLKTELKSTGAKTDTDTVKALESQLAVLTRRYEEMTKRIAEAEAQYDAMAKKMTERARDIVKAQESISDAASVSPAQPNVNTPATDTSLQTQAKAYEELKNEIDAIAGSKTNLIKQMLDEQNAIRLINAELKQINAEQKESGTQTQAQKERVTQLNASLLNHKEALSEVRQSLNNYVKLENAASGSMVELSQSLGRMRMVYRTLSEEERNSPFGQELLASIQQADAKIKELDATIGNHQRNVGNYGQAWNGLGNSIQQLARELPALANGPRVFFSAISNNLPILADEIKRARTEYDKMVKNGEKGVPVWKQIGASILSWQTALTVGITLLTMYGDEIVEWGKKMIKGGKSALTAKDAVKELNKAMVEGSKEAGKSIAQLKVMEAAARDVTKAERERNIAATKVLETMGMAVTAADILKVKTGELTAQINLSTEALIRRAQAQAAMTKIDEQTSKVMEAQSKLEARQNEGIKGKDRFKAFMYSLSPYSGPGFFSAEEVFSGAVDALQKAYDAEKGGLDALVQEFNDRFVSGLLGTETEAEIANRLTESAKEVERIVQAEKDAMRDRARAVKDMQLSVEQARIDAMTEGYDKMKAQRELNLRKEIEQLNRQKEDYIRQVVEQEKAIFDAKEAQNAKEDKNYKIQIFDMESAMAEVAKTDPVVAQYAQAIAYTKRQFAVEAAKQDKQWAKQRAQMARELEEMTEEARIDAMKDGYAKQRAQREYEHRKEIEALERERQEYVEKMVERERSAFEARENENAKKIPGYKVKEFDAGSVKVDTKSYDDTIAYRQTAYVQQEEDILNGLYKQYMSYEDSKKELEKQYLDDILELNNEYILTGDEKYVRSIEQRHKAYVKAMNDLEQKFGTTDYKLIFGDPSKMTSATIEKALDVARKKMAQLDKDADPETFQALSEAIERLENARDNNPFEGWDTSVMGLIQKLHEMRNIRKDIAKYEKEGNKEAKEGADAQLQKSKNDLKKNMAGIGVDAFADGLTKAAEAMERIAEISGDPQLKQTAEILNGTANVISATATGAAAGGWIGALVGGLTSILGEAVNAIVGSEAAFAANQKAMEDYGRGLKELALSLDEDVYDTIFGESVWTKIEHMQELLMKAKKEYDEYVKASVKYMKVTSKIAPDGTIIETGIETGLTSIANAAIKAKGRNKKKYSGTLGTIFSDLFDEQGKLKTDKIEEAKEALKTLQSMELKNDEGVGILEEAIRLAEIAEEHTEKLKDAAKDYLGSVGASLGDSIVDSILRGEDALESFADVAGGIIEQIARDFAASWMIENYLRNFEEDMQNAFLTGDAKQVTEIVGSIVEGLPSVLEAGQNAAKEILDMTVGTNYDLYEKHAKEGSSQQASTKGYQTLSEDTGNELAGRALAQYESNLRMEEATRSMKLSVDLMADNQIQIRDIAAESRALIADSYLELQQIRENTGAIIKPIKNLSDKIDRWDNKIMGL